MGKVTKGPSIKYVGLCTRGGVIDLGDFAYVVCVTGEGLKIQYCTIWMSPKQ